MWSPIPRKVGSVKRLGLIINPIAGIGGRVGLKGSDGVEIQRQAFKLGAEPQAGKRTALALKVLQDEFNELEIISPPGEMGESILLQVGFKPLILGEITTGTTTPEDTSLAAKAMLASQVDLLLFAGGDGTARDIFRGIGDQLPVVGIPAGVKIHSAVYATHPNSAGELAAAFLKNQSMKMHEAEVVDLDEVAFRKGIITTRLYGYLMVPYHRRLVQNSKAPTPATEAAQMESIAWDVVENMQIDHYYVLGPGTTTRAVAECLGLEKTLVGVDVVTMDKVVALDVNEKQLLSLVGDQVAKIVITPIGGQGFLFGRGNQPISAKVIEMVGTDNIQVICTPGKLHALSGRPMLVDTGDLELDVRLCGHISITTGYRDQAVYRVAA
jgi:predicted polyphosphate/ATP-dependent NAD kinase